MSLYRARFEPVTRSCDYFVGTTEPSVDCWLSGSNNCGVHVPTTVVDIIVRQAALIRTVVCGLREHEEVMLILVLMSSFMLMPVVISEVLAMLPAL